jgi:hypothetical protein
MQLKPVRNRFVRSRADVVPKVAETIVSIAPVGEVSYSQFHAIGCASERAAYINLQGIDMRICTGFIWLAVGPIGGFL